jgi:hypothetical protein
MRTVQMSHAPLCQHAGCDSPAVIRCALPNEGPSAEPEFEFFCCIHTQEHGYCWNCGQFFGGIESFDFDEAGLCDECEAEMRRDDADDADFFGDEEPYDFSGFPPLE